MMTFDTTRTRSSERRENDQISSNVSSQKEDTSLLLNFPVQKLQSLNAKINSPRWVVPVLPDQELETLLNYALKLTLAGVDHECEPCVKFYRDEMTTSFIKILNDEAVSSWKINIHNNILLLSGKLIQLCALNMDKDIPYLLELLSIVFDPDNKFHTHNANSNSKQSELYLQQIPANVSEVQMDEINCFAISPSEPRSPKGWLVDLINLFGKHGGFDRFLQRMQYGFDHFDKKKSSQKGTSSPSNFMNNETMIRNVELIGDKCENNSKNRSKELTLQLIYLMLRPFSLCHEFLSSRTIEMFFQPLWIPLIEIFNNLSDDELKRDAKLEGKNNFINGIIKSSRLLIYQSKCPTNENFIKELEMSRLKIILRVLETSSFNGKMNALNEINKILSYVSYYPQKQMDENTDFLNAEKMARWIKETNVLGIILKDSLHQPQYVEKLEKILRFLIKEKSLTHDDLANVWRAQAGKHEAIVKNVHDLLAKLAWDFSTEQLDYLFECFQASMKTANKKQRERLLELSRRLAEDDKNGVMADKVLKLFWALAHSTDIAPEVLDQALASHVKILDYSCSQDKDAQKPFWLNKCVDELKIDGDWVLPSLRLIREICCLYEPTLSVSRSHAVSNRQHVIDRLQNEHMLVILITNSLSNYMEKVRNLVRIEKNLLPSEILLDKRYPHQQQIQERLDFLKFLLKDGQLWLCADQAKQIWQCLAVNAVFSSDRDECFRWFGKLMSDEPDLDPGINKDFFENNILQLDPILLTESGIRCFERFFKAVNSKEEKIKAKHRGYVLEDEDLIGKDYLWRIIMTSSESIAFKAIDLLIEVSTAIGPHLQENISKFHENFVNDCCDKINLSFDRITMLTNALLQGPREQSDLLIRRTLEADVICRVIKVMHEYIKESDRVFEGERAFLSLSRASRGKHICIYIRFQSNTRQLEDVEITTHSNETINSFKRNLLKRLKGASIDNIKIDLFDNNGEFIEVTDDRHPLSLYNIRDKTIINVKLSPIATTLTSSPDSSSESSTGSPLRPCPDMQRSDSESTLPGVIISSKHQYLDFFLKIHQLGCDINHCDLREYARNLLNILPMDLVIVSHIHQMCFVKYKNEGTNDNFIEDHHSRQESLSEQMFVSSDAAHVLYNLEVLQALLMPALDPHCDDTVRFQLAWLHSGIGHFILELLSRNNFMQDADVFCKRAAYQCILKIIKLYMLVIIYTLSKVGDEPSQTLEAETFSKSRIEILKQTLSTVIGSGDHTIKASASKIAQSISDEMLSETVQGENCRKLFKSALQWLCPDVTIIQALINISWASSTGSFHLLETTSNFNYTKCDFNMLDAADFSIFKEALEILSLSLVLNYRGFDLLFQDPNWSKFMISSVLENSSRHVRQIASEQFFYMCTYCSPNKKPFIYIIELLTETLKSSLNFYSSNCSEFFKLFCRILKYGCANKWSFDTCDCLIAQEIEWILSIGESVKKYREIVINEDFLEGRINLTKELTSYLEHDQKVKLNDFMTVLIDDFLFPASKHYLYYRQKNQLIDVNASPPVCRNPQTISAACDLLVSLSTNCLLNMRSLVNKLLDMFFFDSQNLQEWEFLPPVGPRSIGGFCGLKNAGATCYMNSVLQQLYMIPSIRIGILQVVGTCTDPNEDFSGDIENKTPSTDHILKFNDEKENRKLYNIGVLKHVQAIFANLAHSCLQFYAPRGFWNHFRLQGEPVNLREQQDAVEFFMALFESIDEGLKDLGYSQLMGATMGGCFSDQKICQECPHRYSKEEPFSALSVDIRNHSSLCDSLEQYVKGEILEGADAYHCDKCNKKVVTVKRLCLRKLPIVLAIQLKRFEYDYERVCAIKFNDYFEFPRWLDMEPYTVSGLAKVEGEIVDLEEDDTSLKSFSTKYQLTGIVVHSGQASGGHYYSYILQKSNNANEKWFKFDDGDVSECKIHEDDELKAQCFGGDYMGEIYDNNLKRMQFRRQKRWWNAYMLFYTRSDYNEIQFEKKGEQLSLAESRHYLLKMPLPIERSVRYQNIKFLHTKSLFSNEFFAFIRNIIGSSTIHSKNDKFMLSPDLEELSLLSIQLGSQFLFKYGFRAKKSLRGSAIEWFEAISIHIRHSSRVRRWFAQNALLNPTERLAEYILIAPSLDIRTVFVKIIVFFCHFASQDEPLPNYNGSNLSEQILLATLHLLICDAQDYGKHLPHFFSLFLTYAGLGVHERHQLLKLNVTAIFMKLSLDEGPGGPIKYQFPELQKLHQCVSLLVRSSDISSKCHSSSRDLPVKPNVYVDSKIPYDQLLPLSSEAEELLFNRTSYIKKLIEDTNVGDDGIKMLQYCSWENPHFSQSILMELLWHCGFAYWHEMRHHTEILLQILTIEDSWQNHRIHNALMGFPDDREGLLEIIQRNRLNYQKRAYQCIKCLVHLFRKSPVARNMLRGNSTIAQSWSHAVEWLHDELDRQRGIVNQYNYSSWSPPTQSNENTNSFILERSLSAKNILQLAIDLCPDELFQEQEDSIAIQEINNEKINQAADVIVEKKTHEDDNNSMSNLTDDINAIEISEVKYDKQCESINEDHLEHISFVVSEVIPEETSK